jgi:hypothetical protein
MGDKNIMNQNKKGQNITATAIVFLVLWLITNLVWSIWLDGVYVAVIGCITSLGVIGAMSLTINLKG